MKKNQYGDGRTDGRTDHPTDEVTYRVASHATKKNGRPKPCMRPITLGFEC